MTIYRPELVNINSLKQVPLTLTHPYHMVPRFENILEQGAQISGLGKKTGAETVTRSGTFSDAMLGALDKVSAYQQFASSLEERIITDPDSLDPHDVSIAQAEASMALNITRNILNRIVQGWRDIINTR